MEKPFRERKIFISSSINSRRFDRSQSREWKKEKKKIFFSAHSNRATTTERACTIWSTLNKLYTTTFFLPFTCRFCPISYSSLTRRIWKKGRVEDKTKKRKNSSSKKRIRKLTNIDWIFFCLCFDFYFRQQSFCVLAFSSQIVFLLRNPRTKLEKL